MSEVTGASPLLVMTGIVKQFPGARALDGVDLDVRPGEVHALLGQNGAGKSTLIKVLAGAHQPDEGTIVWGGEAVRLTHPLAAMRLGIATIYQELDLVDGLSVAENVFLGHEHSAAGIIAPRHGQRAPPPTLLGRLGHPELRPDREVGRLSAAGKQIVEHGPRAVARRSADRHGRAVGRARLGRGGEPVPGDPRPHVVGCRGGLHHAPARGDPGDR